MLNSRSTAKIVAATLVYFLGACSAAEEPSGDDDLKVKVKPRAGTGRSKLTLKRAALTSSSLRQRAR